VRRPDWDLIPYALVALVLVVSTGFGIYVAGPWRLWVFALAVLLALAAATRPLAQRDALAPLSHPWAIWPLAFVCIAGNWGWAANDVLYRLLAVTSGALLVALLVLARRWLHRPTGQASRGGDVLAWVVILSIAAAYYGAILELIPRPHVDAWDHMNRAGDAWLAGRNPYDQFVPDFYGGRFHYGFDAPGFPYPPLVLALATLARALGIDVRVILLASLLAGATLLRQIALRRRWSPDAANAMGAVYLWIPRLGFFIENSHSEPLSGLLFVAAIHALVWGRAVAAAGLLGLFASSKQYLAVVVPLLLIACRSPRELAALIAAATLPWIPFVWWNPGALWDAAFRVHLERPPRPDALTLNAWLLGRGLPALPRWLPLASGALVAVRHGMGRKPGAPLLCSGIAGALLVAFFTSPQAFGNYFSLATWILLAGIAATPADRSSDV
jgi:hypothetical protein